QNVALCLVIEAYESQCLVLRRRRDIHVMELEKLMIQHPTDAHRVLRSVPVAEFPDNVPNADKIIEERVGEGSVAPVGGSRALRAHRGSKKRDGQEQGKTSHKRDVDRVSSFARCRKRLSSAVKIAPRSQLLAPCSLLPAPASLFPFNVVTLLTFLTSRPLLIDASLPGLRTATLPRPNRLPTAVPRRRVLTSYFSLSPRLTAR